MTERLYHADFCAMPNKLLFFEYFETWPMTGSHVQVYYEIFSHSKMTRSSDIDLYQETTKY
jgi:hypothetical protein